MTEQVFPLYLPSAAEHRLEYEYGMASLVYTERSLDHGDSDTETDIPLNAEQIAEMIAWLQSVQADLARRCSAG